MDVRGIVKHTLKQAVLYRNLSVAADKVGRVSGSGDHPRRTFVSRSRETFHRDIL